MVDPGFTSGNGEKFRMPVRFYARDWNRAGLRREAACGESDWRMTGSIACDATLSNRMGVISARQPRSAHRE
jgi:hypothetical protein